MTDRKSAIENAVELFMKNPYWKKEYDTAPSEACRRYIQLEFYQSLYEDSGIVQEMKSLENQLGIEDWEHILKYTAHNPFRTRCKQRIAVLKEAQRR